LFETFLTAIRRET